MRSNRLAAVFCSALMLAGCAQQLRPDDPNVRGIGYVRVDEVLKKHPLYSQLSQLQNAIDALGLRSLGPAIPRTQSQIAAQTRELNRELTAAQEHANAILRQKQQDYEQREQAAVRAALASAGAGTNGTAPVTQMQSTSRAQAQQVTAQANADFMAYQRSVIAADNAAVAQVTAQLNDRVNRAYRQRATQLQEQESQLGLELSQQDAAKRLDLRMKLNNLALADAQRTQYRQQLTSLDQQEAAAVQARRNADAAQLQGYLKQLRQSTQRDLAAQVAKIHQATRDKLAQRRNEVSQQVASQLQGLSPQAVPSNLPAQTRQRLAQIDQQFKARFQADAAQTIRQYQQTKADLDAQYASLQGANGAAGGASGRELSDLQKQRDDLYNKMVEQIKRDAGQVAAKRGLQVVFMNVEAAGGGIDLTGDVEKDIESLHQ